MPNHAYCEVGDAVQPVTVEPLQELDKTGRYRGGDMVCAVCGFIARTLYETMLDETLQQLRDKGVDARRLDEYVEVWTVAIDHDGERLPCPTCFASARHWKSRTL